MDFNGEYMEINNNGICAVKFGANWCGPCKTLAPRMEKMENEFPKIEFYSVNVDDSPALAQKFKIKSLPTVILLKDGEEVERISGSVLIDSLRKAFRTLLTTIE